MTLHFALTESVAPAAEPFTAAEAKLHLRVDSSDDDTYISALIKAARKKLEADTGRALITQTWKLILDRFPDSDDEAILMPKAPLQSVSSITYVDTDGVTQTWDSSEYRVDTDSVPGRITPAYNQSWPTTRSVTGAVTITFVAGYGNSSQNIPDDLRHAMRLLIGHWYENREEVVAGVSIAQVPQAYQFLKQSHTIWNF